jgi:hypothetical protein
MIVRSVLRFQLATSSLGRSDDQLGKTFFKDSFVLLHTGGWGVGDSKGQ